jgi:hypothetical protein
MTKLSTGLALLLAAGAAAAQPRVISDRTAGGFVFPESAAYDAREKVLYVGNFGGDKLAPAEKDGKGYISKVSLEGKVLVQKVWPLPGAPAINKPKGIWIQGDRLWFTDIDQVWIYDLRTRKARGLPLPGVGFANDPAVMDGALYVSDNRADKLVKVTPADFLNIKGEPRVTTVFTGANVQPNGVYPTRIGILLMGGMQSPEQPRGIFMLGVSGQVRPLTDPIGRIDGLYQMADGSLLFTNWDTGSLSHWSEKTGVTVVASGFKGPADFCVVPGKDGEMTVVVPDLPQSHLRIIKLTTK